MQAKKPIDPKLLKILACPLCKSDLKLKKKKKGWWLLCTNKRCRESYPIEEGIPIMLPKELR
jgi:tetraacyldisaccharide 4'-kinase